MRHFLTLLLVVFLGSAVSLQAAVVGEPSPLIDGDVDGWSGITIMNGYGGLPAGELVETVNYYANGGRADGNHHVQMLIAKEEAGGSTTIWDIGPVVTPTEAGEQSVAWGSQVVPNDGNVYHPAIWQWNEGVDDTAGGVVPFASGGSGMFQQNQDGTSYVPAIGDDLTIGQQHASGPGGRAYQVNYTTAVPEPSTAILLSLALLPLVRLARRRR